ncbi:MAG: FtsX-like permease family protein [Methylococcaceae bacterium]
MTTLLNKSSRQFLFRHPWQLFLAILGITLGVAVVVSIDLAMNSAMSSFTDATKALAGEASHRIIGNNGQIDETLYTKLRVKHGIANLSPVVQENIQLAEPSGHNFQLYGIDPFTEDAFKAAWQTEQTSNQAIRLLTEPGTVLIGASAAAKLNLAVNDTLAVITPIGQSELIIVGLLQPTNALQQTILQTLIVADIATAQEVLGLQGKLSYIDVILDGKATSYELKISDHLTADTQLVSTDSTIQSMQQMTEAFSINLTALSLLSVLVGMFLIYNTMTFLVVQRRQLIGGLRSLGVTRKQIFQLIIKEALLLAIIGTITGILLGILLGHNILELVSSTLNTFYFRVDGAALQLSPWLIGKGFMLGICATLTAILLPAWEATQCTPNSVMRRSQLETTSRQLINKMAWVSLLFLLSGVMVILFSGKSIPLGLTSIFLIMFGCALLTPKFTLLLMQIIEPITATLFGIIGRLPTRLVSAEISRTGIAVAALMIAVSATIGMDLMINSFRQTVSDWLKASLQADFYVSLSGSPSSDQRIKSDHLLTSEIMALPGIDSKSSIIRNNILSGQQLIKVYAYEIAERSKSGFDFRQQSTPNLWKSFEQDDVLIVTEPYAYHHDVELGDPLFLQTTQGTKPFSIIGIYTDYNADHGHVTMSRQTYLRHWPPAGYSGIGIYTQPGTDLEQLEQRLQQLVAANPSIDVQATHKIYQASMDVFEQTFLITQTLRWLAAGIAFVGVFSALMALQFERTRVLGMLRAMGFTSGQITRLISTETGLMGLVAGLFAVPVGYLIASILIFVVYRRSFGWTMHFYLDWSVLYQGILLATIAALLAGILPAYKMSQTRPAEALRSE